MLRPQAVKSSLATMPLQRARPMRIGIDFDNTIISYDQVFLDAAVERGLLGEGFNGTTKQAIRDAIRLLPDGEMSWQRLQGFIYSRGIDKAVMFDGVDRFLHRARAEGHEVLIVSHKTDFGHLDPERRSLREAALEWMERHGFFTPAGYAIPRENVYFETTRAEKLARIACLQCTHFVDDLEEVLDDVAFPQKVRRVLFASTAFGGAHTAYPICPTWRDIEKAVLGERP